MKYLLVILIVAFSVLSYGQTDYRPMAIQYFNQQDYEKASIYYLKLYETTKSHGDFEKYYTCLVELKNYKEAEKLMKKELKKKNPQLTLYLLYADLYTKQELLTKATQQYEVAVKNIQSYHTFGQINHLANEFQVRREVDFAIKAYEKAKKMAANPVSYNIRIGELYGAKGETELMIKEFISMLETNPAFQAQVQGALNRQIDFKEDEKKTTLLKNELIHQTQKHPNQSVYNEMLIWLFQQKGEFGAAFVQVKALDKKRKLNGQKVFNFAETCDNNEQYDLAIKAFQYVIDLGKTNRYYRSANYRSLNTLKKKITQSPNYTREDLLDLETKYKFTLTDVGRAPHSINMMKDLGHLQGFYLQKFDEAVELLEDAVRLAARTPKVEGECKMLLADVMVIKGNIWDASLYYSQVDKAFKEDKLSHEAKFKNAKIFYYTGNFILAQSQLDVLKASTQKLIANDAMELSLLITDNLALDTTANTMRMFAKADLLIVQHRYAEAIEKFDSINAALPYHTLNDEILIKKYEIDYRKQKYEAAAVHLTEIVAKYGDDILADNALFLLGEMYEKIFKDEAKAIEYYDQLIFNYQGSMYGVEARKRSRALKGDTPDARPFKEIE